MKRLKAFFTGTVQGVGFRVEVQRLAQGYPLTGYVRNLYNGQVEVVAEGEDAVLHDFLKALRESSLAAYIRGVKTEWDEARGEFYAFRISR